MCESPKSCRNHDRHWVIDSYDSRIRSRIQWHGNLFVTAGSDSCTLLVPGRQPLEPSQTCVARSSTTANLPNPSRPRSRRVGLFGALRLAPSRAWFPHWFLPTAKRRALGLGFVVVPAETCRSCVYCSTKSGGGKVHPGLGSDTEFDYLFYGC